MTIEQEKKNTLLNIIFNLASGLQPENLTPNEIEILTEEYGEDWFNKLGYKKAD